MTQNPNLSALEAGIVSLYKPAHAAYREYLTDHGRMPYPIIQTERQIEFTGYGLYRTIISKVMQNYAVGNQIHFQKNDSYATTGDMDAVISYASRAEIDKENKLMGAHWNRRNGPAREIMGRFGYESSLVCLAAIDAKVQPVEILEVYPHISANELKRTQIAYEMVREACELDPENVRQLIVLRSLRRYHFDQFQGGGFLSNATLSLARLSQNMSPTAERAEKIETMVTSGMSAHNYNQMEKATLEQLIADGYQPLAPAQYAAWVRRILTED